MKPDSEQAPSARSPDDPGRGIDTSKMSARQRAAVEATEAARDAVPAREGFAAGLFLGDFRLDRIHPLPALPDDDVERTEAFLHKLSHVLRRAEPDQIDRDGEIPDAIFDALADAGAFGIKIPRKYGGLGLSQTAYIRAATILGSWCGNLTALLSAHQSIGVPQPLLLFGTEEQKAKYLPRVARGEVSAFALTEVNAGSDPSRIEMTAEPEPDGRHFVLNGEKLWCTNGTRASVIIAMARTPEPEGTRSGKSSITAFIIDMDTPGVEVVRRCRFMGLRALYNGVIRFRNARVARENIVLEEGKGLKVALTTLNAGRLTLPAACTGLSKRCLKITRDWANEREQWGAPIGRHAAVADKIGEMAADVYAMEAMSLLTARLIDTIHGSDIRFEAAMCKMWGTERAWRIVDDTLQIRGGRGFETAESLAARGEEPVPVERYFRDSRINLIFEGSSEIMRLFLAREALDPHLRAAGALLDSRLPAGDRARAAFGAAVFYAGWYPARWVPRPAPGLSRFPPPLRPHLRSAARAARHLSRKLFHAMVWHGPKLEREQLLLGNIVDAGTEIFAVTATCLRAEQDLIAADPERKKEILALTDTFCTGARLRIQTALRGRNRAVSRRRYRLARDILEGRCHWLEGGILQGKGPRSENGS